MPRLTDEGVKEALEHAQKDAFYEHDPQRYRRDRLLVDICADLLEARAVLGALVLALSDKPMVIVGASEGNGVELSPAVEDTLRTARALLAEGEPRAEGRADAS